jgi:transcription elongation factor Elf1
MKGKAIPCPRCKRLPKVPRAVDEKSLQCGSCGEAIGIRPPDALPSADVILEQQDDILVDYHDRLIQLYERTTPLIEAVRAGRNVAETAMKEAQDRERRRVVGLVESARIQLTAIVDGAEHKARHVNLARRFPNKLRCPHCRRFVRYKDKAEGMSLRCPNPSCERPIAIPSPSERFWEAVNYLDGGEEK